MPWWRLARCGLRIGELVTEELRDGLLGGDVDELDGGVLEADSEERIAEPMNGGDVGGGLKELLDVLVGGVPEVDLVLEAD